MFCSTLLWPEWESLHPLVIHFPIALLLVAPLAIVAGVAWVRHREVLFAVGWALMALGTVAAYVSVLTGEAAARVADRTPAINRMLAQHEQMAEHVLRSFGLFTVIWLAVLVIVRLRPRHLPAWLRWSFPPVFLAFYVVSSLELANMAHAGGLLVHSLGLRADMSAAREPTRSGPPAEAPSLSGARDGIRAASAH